MSFLEHACFQLWDVVGHFDFSASLVCALTWNSGIAKSATPEKSQKDQLQEQFATALMIQYGFSELEWGSLAKLGCPACFIFHPKHHCCTSSVYQGDAVWVSIGGQVWCQQRAVVLAAGCWVSIGGQVWCQQRAVKIAAGCWIVWPLAGVHQHLKETLHHQFFLDWIFSCEKVVLFIKGDYFSKSLSSMMKFSCSTMANHLSKTLWLVELPPLLARWATARVHQHLKETLIYHYLASLYHWSCKKVLIPQWQTPTQHFVCYWSWNLAVE